MKLFNGFVLCLVFVCLQVSRADTTWVASGNVSGAWSAAGSPYMIHEGDVTVATGDALTIGPGVTVFFSGAFKMEVSGLLQVNGTAQDSIWFTGSPVDFPMDTPQRWKGLRFWDADPDCRLAYCSISYSGATGGGILGVGGGLFCFNTDLHVEHSRIHHCHASYACGASFDASDVVLEYTDITNNIGTLDPNFQVINGSIGGLRTRTTTIHMRHCKVTSNYVGTNFGGIRFETGTVATLDTCLIDGNRTDGGWEGISADSTTVLSMTGTTISNHEGYSSGFTNGLRFLGERLFMDACTLRNNQASWIGPEPLNGDGGGALMILNPQSALVQNSVFEGNSGDYGGAMLCSSTIIENSVFRNNHAGDGGALASIGNNMITGCRFENNQADVNFDCMSCPGWGTGGAINFVQGTDSVLGCHFEGNHSAVVWEEFNGEEFVQHTLGWKGGALYCASTASPYLANCVLVNNSLDYPDGGGSGSVLYNMGGSPTFESCTMYDNGASGHPGGVIFMDGGNLTVNSCIVSHSTASCAIYFDQGAGGEVEYCNFFGISGVNFLGTPPIGLGTISTTNANSDPCDAYNNIFLDPSYVDAANGDLHLSNISPLLGAADPLLSIDTDFEGNARPNPGLSLPDIGAYESYLGGRFVSVEHLVISRAEGTNSMVLYWDMNPQAISYQVYSCPLPECTLVEMTLQGTTATNTFTDTNVLTLPDEQRYYVVMGSTAP